MRLNVFTANVSSKQARRISNVLFDPFPSIKAGSRGLGKHSHAQNLIPLIQWDEIEYINNRDDIHRWSGKLAIFMMANARTWQWEVSKACRAASILPADKSKPTYWRSGRARFVRVKTPVSASQIQEDMRFTVRFWWQVLEQKAEGHEQNPANLMHAPCPEAHFRHDCKCYGAVGIVTVAEILSD